MDQAWVTGLWVPFLKSVGVFALPLKDVLVHAVCGCARGEADAVQGGTTRRRAAARYSLVPTRAHEGPVSDTAAGCGVVGCQRHAARRAGQLTGCLLSRVERRVSHEIGMFM